MSIFSDISHDKISQYRPCGIEIIKTRARIFFHNQQRLVLSVDKSRQLMRHILCAFCAYNSDLPPHRRIFRRSAGALVRQWRVCPCQLTPASITNTHRKGRYNMKATGIVRRIDDLGRVVIPKEIRRTMRIREGDPLQMTLSPWEKFCFAMLDLSKRWGLNCT